MRFINMFGLLHHYESHFATVGLNQNLFVQKIIHSCRPKQRVDQTTVMHLKRIWSILVNFWK